MQRLQVLFISNRFLVIKEVIVFNFPVTHFQRIQARIHGNTANATTTQQNPVVQPSTGQQQEADNENANDEFDMPLPPPEGFE